MVKPAKKKIVVLIDPAHGGMDVGANGVGISEKEIKPESCQ
jgi:N-acetylmuramoyl-L-alanine amidase